MAFLGHIGTLSRHRKQREFRKYAISYNIVGASFKDIKSEISISPILSICIAHGAFRNVYLEILNIFSLETTGNTA